MYTFTDNLDGTVTIGFGVFTPADAAKALRELPKITSEEALKAVAKLKATFAKAVREAKRSRRPKRSRRSAPLPSPVLPEPGITLARLALFDQEG